MVALEGLIGSKEERERRVAVRSERFARAVATATEARKEWRSTNGAELERSTLAEGQKKR
ncbi:MAG: hypothetical protein M3220_19825 [Chloroflexota bacterium]|nr:hypothetical protein [Chloroflexota bacterium]